MGPLPAPTHTAAVLYGARDLRLEAVPTPALQPHEVQIRPRATGLCGTDMHYYQNGRNGIYTVRDPLVLGHEAAGEVVAVGADVTTLRVGDRVAVEPQLACRQCRPCLTGRYNLCPHMRFNGSASARPPAQGALQTRWNHPAYLCFPLPDRISYREGAVVEPLSVALHAVVHKGRLQAGQTVFIAGAGAIGLLCARVAKIAGASFVTMVDVDAARLAFAKAQTLADHTVRIPLWGGEGGEESSSAFAARLVQDMRQPSGGWPAHVAPEADLALDCTGVESCLNMCVHAVAAGAKVVLVGMGPPVQQINTGVALAREIELVGVWRYTNTFQPAINLIAAGIVDVQSMITHTFPLSKVRDALELVVSRPPDLLKCVVTSED